ncbi:hypothetical protein AJ80_06832 [Polytolypa hystricis UAMH7299]|uniref:Uncharacterized protein n=1 Tax=Polytolypa hystricis (strain UAMH7299) TaxID=1447883 RepID=A0A2B7XTK8_POLH7|nr:hypothetical protein AJ80_06832 [Polytolypa hystricis UAMH7299]
MVAPKEKDRYMPFGCVNSFFNPETGTYEPLEKLGKKKERVAAWPPKSVIEPRVSRKLASGSSKKSPVRRPVAEKETKSPTPIKRLVPAKKAGSERKEEGKKSPKVIAKKPEEAKGARVQKVERSTREKKFLTEWFAAITKK